MQKLAMAFDIARSEVVSCLPRTQLDCMQYCNVLLRKTQSLQQTLQQQLCSVTTSTALEDGTQW